MMDSRIKIISLNVGGFGPGKGPILEFLRTESPHIVLLQEHGRINDERIKIWNYNILQQNRSNERFDGVAIGIRKDVSYKHLRDPEDVEMLAVEIESNRGPIAIATAYQPPRRPRLHRGDLIRFFRRDIPAILLGDLNARCRSSGYTTQFNNQGTAMERYLREGFLQRIGPDFPTFITRRSKTKPDIILANNAPRPNYWIRPGKVVNSDHLPMIMDLSWSPIQIPHPPRRMLSKTNWNRYHELLNDVELDNLRDGDTLNNIDRKLHIIISKMQEAANRVIPISKYKTLPHPHYSEVERRKISRLEVLKNKSLHLPLSHDEWIEWRTLKADLLLACKLRNAEEWNNVISKVDSTTEPKEFWNQIKRLQGTNKDNNTFIFGPNGEKLYKPEEKIPIFTQHWKNVFTEIRTEEEQENAEINMDHVAMMYSPLNSTPYGVIEYARLYLNNRDLSITMDELKYTLSSIGQKAAGLDEITKLHITKSPPYFITTILNYFNAALSCGYFPRPFKNVKMILIPKPGKNQKDHTNYRPISLLSVLGKVFGKIINQRLRTQLQTHGHINPRQHGFTADLGTTTATALMWEAISKGKKLNHRVTLTNRDVAGAFDRVWHLGLKYKLQNLDLPDLFIRILSSYLDDRIATIFLGNHEGQPFGLECGVPQGGCLSPTLYNIYIHDIPAEVYPRSLDIFYADDATQIIRATTRAEMRHVWGTETNRINSFEKDWLIKTNTTKFKTVPIGGPSSKEDDLHFEGAPNPINTNEVTTILGLKITKCGIKSHITRNVSLSKTNLSKLYRFKNLSLSNRRKLYLMLVRSTLTYPVIPLHVTSKAAMIRMQRVQNKALFFILGNQYRYQDTEQRHLQANIEPINMFLHRCAINCWNKINRLIPNDIIQRVVLADVPDQHLYGDHCNFPSSMDVINSVAHPFYVYGDEMWG